MTVRRAFIAGLVIGATVMLVLAVFINNSRFVWRF